MIWHILRPQLNYITLKKKKDLLATPAADTYICNADTYICNVAKHFSHEIAAMVPHVKYTQEVHNSNS